MDDLRKQWAFLTDWIPDDVRSWAPPEVWWLAFLAAGLIALLLVGMILKAFLVALFRRRRKPLSDWEPELREDLSSLPMPNTPASASVFHVPARVRLIVLAPAGKGSGIDKANIGWLLDRVVPGLGLLAHRDRPRIVVWPAPASTLGFAGSFHRATGRDGGEESSNWVMLAGRAKGGGQTVFLGLALWTDEPTTLGRRNIDGNEWLGVLRL